jgi:hypothetical protein
MAIVLPFFKRLADRGQLPSSPGCQGRAEHPLTAGWGLFVGLGGAIHVVLPGRSRGPGGLPIKGWREVSRHTVRGRGAVNHKLRTPRRRAEPTDQIPAGAPAPITGVGCRRARSPARLVEPSIYPARLLLRERYYLGA